MINGDLLRFNIKDKKIIFFDFEGDLNLFYGRPFEIAYSIYRGLEKQSEFCSYLKWDNMNISEDVKRITKFNEATWKEKAVHAKEIFPQFHNFIYDEEYIIAGANILGFDAILLSNLLKELGLRYDYSYLNRCYDANPLFKAYKLGIKPDNENLLAWQFSINSIVRRGLKSNVGLIAKEFGIECNEEMRHNALYDIDIEAKNFFELIKRIEVK